ncbi:hypothetical protein [Pontiella sulfatireligans]|uniref:Carbohydrate-binding domain-containing protein n=1 Tax=Pontiella sulfatireligans TaxID=2750658 RepID=A0A6C2UMT7_9BACT|nr:hypothetical protein [Pontiella sulfatireligans]VGO20687.1 hypothetical protein SCARR_02753 [Pontiella sulfatireligans]
MKLPNMSNASYGSLGFEAARHPGFGPAYAFSYSTDREGEPLEGASVRFAWDESGLFVLAELEDSCLIQKNRTDEQLHYESGDLFELFVKPLNEPYKWEMYATPFGNKSTLFFPSWPTELTPEEGLTQHEFHGLDVSVEQTPNGWNARMFVPVTQLTALGAGWGDGTEWTVFCGRYNCNSEDLADPELSMAPPLSATNYHLINEYARLVLSGGHA